jgi:hypothetical protein
VSKSFRSFVISALLFSLCAAPVVARRHAPPTPSPTPIPPADPAVTAIAQREFVSRQAGIVDRSRLTQEYSGRLTSAELEQESELLGPFGALTATTYLGPIEGPPGTPPTYHAYLYKMTCANGVIYERLLLAPNGKVADEVYSDTETIPSPTP